MRQRLLNLALIVVTFALPATAAAWYPLAEGSRPGPFAHPLTGGVPYCGGPRHLNVGFVGPVYRLQASSIQADGTETVTVDGYLGVWACSQWGWREVES